jgi:hypothetical protein
MEHAGESYIWKLKVFFVHLLRKTNKTHKSKENKVTTKIIQKALNTKLLNISRISLMEFKSGASALGCHFWRLS